MQGTIVMLMALSGLGCHHKSCDVAYVPSYYGTGGCYGGCYGGGYATVVEPSCYSGCYSSGYSGCYSSGYSGGYDSCYSGCYGGGYDSCYSGRRHGCLLSGLFHCFGGWGGSWKQGCGLFGHHRGYGYDDGYYGNEFGGDYYSTTYSDYSPAVFGSSVPIYERPLTAGSPAAEAPATPAPETPATPAPAAAQPGQTSVPTPPPPTPATGAPAVTPPSVPAPPTPAPSIPDPAAVKPKI
jgi:hypothetical protein